MDILEDENYQNNFLFNVKIKLYASFSTYKVNINI